MRQRKAKDLEKRLRECSAYMIENPGQGGRDYFGHGMSSSEPAAAGPGGTDVAGSGGNAAANSSRRDLFVEIGCGKGQFIISKAAAHPEADFIAIEGQETVILRALEKARDYDGADTDGSRSGDFGDSEDGHLEDDIATSSGRLPNLRFMLTFVHTMDELFDEGQLSGIYLNFSDPWPKARHAKRRLTHRDRLKDYAWALKSGGFIEMKTDNDDLYDFTLGEIEAVGYEIVQQTRDLHNSSFESRLTTTEYEDKFSGRGKNINYVKVVVK